MKAEQRVRNRDDVLSSSTPLSNFMLTISSDQPIKNDFFITSTSQDDARSSSLERLERSEGSSDMNDMYQKQNRLYSLISDMQTYKVDPKEQERLRLEEEKQRKKQESRKHITLLENMQKIGRKSATPKKGATGGGDEDIKKGLAMLMNAGQKKPKLVKKEGQDAKINNKDSENQNEEQSTSQYGQKHGHKHEPVSGISRLTMILKGEDPETLRKKALMEDPEQRRLYSQMISPKAQPRTLLLKVSGSATNLTNKKQKIYFNQPDQIKNNRSSRNIDMVQHQTPKNPSQANNFDIEPVSYQNYTTQQATPKQLQSQFRAPSTYIRDLQAQNRRNIPHFLTQFSHSSLKPPIIQQNYLSMPTGGINSINASSRVLFLKKTPSKTSLKGSIIEQTNSENPKIIGISPNSAKQRGHIVKIEKKVDEKVFVLTPQDVSSLFQSKIQDLGIQFFQNQYQRFADHCEKTCINRRLVLNEQKFGIQGAKTIALILCQNKDRDSIAHIDLSRNNIGDSGVKYIAEALCKVHSVISLNLSSNSITSEGGAELINLLMYNYSLIDLNISSHEGLQRNTLGPAGAKPLRELLNVNRFLTILNLSGNFIGDLGVCYLGEGLQRGPVNTTLKSLNLQSNDITGDGAEKLYRSLKNTKITHLILSKNPLKVKGAKAVGDMIMKGNDINLDFLDISECQITHQGAVFIYQGIRRCQSIEILIMDKNRLTAKFMPELSQAFWMNNTLLKLSMVRCELYDDGCIYLFDGIERNMKLLELNISDNNLRSLSAKRIAEVLTVRDVCLESLNLSYNALTDSGVQQIFQSLYSNRVLKKLDLYDNQLNDQTVRILYEVVKKNPKLTHLNLGMNKFDHLVIKQINELCKRNIDRAQKAIVPNHVKQIVALNLKASRFNDVYKQIEEKEATRREQQEKFDVLDQKVEKYKRKSTERRTLLSEAQKEYQEDIDELDREIAYLNNAEVRSRKLLQNDYDDMNRRVVRERKEREMLQELVDDQMDALRVHQFKQKEEYKKTRDQLADQQNRQRIAEVSYKVLLKEVLQFRPPWPTDLMVLGKEEALSFIPPKPGDYGQVEFQTSIARYKEEREFLRTINGSQRKKKNKKPKK